MFNEILKITPKLDGAGLNSLESGLNRRFAKVAKKFGGGILSALKGGGAVAIVTTLVDKVLNPLQAVQEALDKTLHTGEDIASQAKEFNSSAGNIARLQAFGKASNLDPELLRLLLVKFQGAAAQAVLHPENPSVVSNYKNRPDTAEAFFEFIQARQKLNPTQKSLVDQELFGERIVGRTSEFLEQNFARTNQAIGGPSSQELTSSINKNAAVAHGGRILEASRFLDDIKDKSKAVNLGQVISLDKNARFQNARDTKNLSNFDRLERLQLAGERIASQLETAFSKIAPLLAPALEAIPGILDKLNAGATAVQKSRAVRGLLPGQGKDK